MAGRIDPFFVGGAFCYLTIGKRDGWVEKIKSYYGKIKWCGGEGIGRMRRIFLLAWPLMYI